MVIDNPAPTVAFLGAEPAEIWGGVQGDFLIDAPGHKEKEVAIILNEPTAKELAELTGEQDSDAFRLRVLRIFGKLWLEKVIREGMYLNPQYYLSTNLFERYPDYFEEAKAALRSSIV